MMKSAKARQAVFQFTLCFAIFMLWMVFGAGCGPGDDVDHKDDDSIQPYTGSQHTVDDFFYADGKPIPVEIALDQLAVLAKSDVTADSIRTLIAPFNLSIIQKYPGGFFVLGLQNPLTREELNQLARQLETQGQHLLRAAGLTLATPGSTRPMCLTDKFIAQFAPEATLEPIEAFNHANHVRIVQPDPFVRNQFLLAVMDSSDVDALSMANRYQNNPMTKFSHANFWVVYTIFETIPTDPLFASQWHLHNPPVGPTSIVDADIDAPLAWDITKGSPNVVIAMLDDGFELTHEDLAANLFKNPGEISNNATDDDENGLVDDVNGWDFVDNDNDPSPGSATTNHHGTAMTGLAVAREGNSLGVVGVCPQSRFLPIRVAGTNTVQAFANAFAFAQATGARIINNSWGHTSPSEVVPTVIADAINKAAAAGCIIFFAAGNANSSGWCGTSYPSLTNVIAVSSSTNYDLKVVTSAFGNCIDLLAPSHRGQPFTGSANITTTDRSGTAGFNSANRPLNSLGLTEAPNNKYTNFFFGTSSASALAAGTAGLVVSANNTLTRVQVQRLLQDTADKIAPDSAAYADNTGFSSTYSWGRINAFEAVRLAAPAAQVGKAGVDIFLRDNTLDWGNTEQPSTTRFTSANPRGAILQGQSVDIKVDAPAFLFAALPTLAQFEAMSSENLKSGVNNGVSNKVYVRVRNRGPVTASSVIVYLYWATATGATLPSLPTNFWSVFPESVAGNPWVLVGTQDIENLAYSGSSVAGCPGRSLPSCGWDLNGDGDTNDTGETATDNAQIVQFNFTAPSPGAGVLLAIIDSEQDRVLPKARPPFSTDINDIIVDFLAPRDNNVSFVNATVVP